MPASLSASGVGMPGKATALGARRPHSGFPPRRESGPSEAGFTSDLRPPWPSWTPARAPPAWMASTMRAKPATCPPSHRPRSRGDSRPSGLTAVASTTIVPNPPEERAA